MGTNKPVVVGIGELLWDVFPNVKRAGGAPVNFVYHAAQSGADGYAISAVGNDPLGDEIVGELESSSISSDYICRVNYPTGTVLVELNNGIPSYTITEGVAWDHIPSSPKYIDLMRRADAVCFGTLAQRSAESKATLIELLSYIPKDAIRFFDINIRQNFYSKDLIDELLGLANVLKINDEELELMIPMFGLEGSVDEVCQSLIGKYGLRYLVLTAGANYSSIYSASEISTIATPKVDVIDTVGAGDSFSGSFVASILAGSSLREAHQRAVEVAAFVCTQSGAWPKYKNLIF